MFLFCHFMDICPLTQASKIGRKGIAYCYVHSYLHSGLSCFWITTLQHYYIAAHMMACRLEIPKARFLFTLIEKRSEFA